MATDGWKVERHKHRVDHPINKPPDFGGLWGQASVRLDGCKPGAHDLAGIYMVK